MEFRYEVVEKRFGKCPFRIELALYTFFISRIQIATECVGQRILEDVEIFGIIRLTIEYIRANVSHISVLFNMFVVDDFFTVVGEIDLYGRSPVVFSGREVFCGFVQQVVVHNRNLVAVFVRGDIFGIVPTDDLFGVFAAFRPDRELRPFPASDLAVLIKVVVFHNGI